MRDGGLHQQLEELPGVGVPAPHHPAECPFRLSTIFSHVLPNHCAPMFSVTSDTLAQGRQDPSAQPGGVRQECTGMRFLIRVYFV
jgi:hypothetical protein